LKLKTVFIINAAFAAFGGLSLLLAPEQTFSSYGATLNPGGVFVAHILGVTVLGVSVISYMFRNVRDKHALKPVLIGFIIAHAGSAVFAFLAAVTGLFNQMVWFDVIAHGVLAAGFGYYLQSK